MAKKHVVRKSSGNAKKLGIKTVYAKRAGKGTYAMKLANGTRVGTVKKAANGMWTATMGKKTLKTPKTKSNFRSARAAKAAVRGRKFRAPAGQN